MTQGQIPDSLVDLMAQLREEGVPEWQYHRRIMNYFAWKARERGIPFTGTFELTPLCNLDCKMCYVHLTREQMGGAEQMKPETWKNLMEQAIDAGMRKARLTGGECLAYPGFDELYLYLQSRGVEVMVLTNGVLLDEARVAFFQKHPPCEIQVTLYGSDEDAYERVTGRRAFRQVWENLNRANRAELPLTIAITPSRFMESDADALLDRAEELGLPYNINFGLFDPRADTGRQPGLSMDASLEMYMHLYHRKRAYQGIALSPIDERELPSPGTSAELRKGVRCAAGRSMFEIDWTGTMYGCTNLRSVCARPLESSFAAAWQTVRAGVQEVIIPSECGSCVYAPICVVCPAAHEQDGSSTHCNPIYCKRVRRMVAEGLNRIPE